MSVERVPPNTIVEINDGISGGRKLGLVDETGLGYFDLHGESELPKPLHAELLPQGLGTITSWLESLPADDCDKMSNVWKYLSDRNHDVLTIARGLRWGLQNHTADPELLEKMGIAATNQIRDGQRIIEKIIKA